MARIDLGLAAPLTHRLPRPDTEELGDLAHRRQIRPMIDADLTAHPDRPLTQLDRVRRRRSPCHELILPEDWSLRTRRAAQYLVTRLIFLVDTIKA